MEFTKLTLTVKYITNCFTKSYLQLFSITNTLTNDEKNGKKTIKRLLKLKATIITKLLKFRKNI